MSFKVIVLIALILCCCLMSCTSKPAEPNVKSAIDLMSHTCTNCYSVIQISQSIGQMADNRYSVAFSAIIEMRKKAFLVRKKDAAPDKPIDLQDIRPLKVSKKDRTLHAGTKYEVNGSMFFTQSQKEWIPVGLAIEKFSKI